jgi:hypothetical protein
LELQLLHSSLALVLDAEGRTRRDAHALARYANAERSPLFQGIGQAPELGDERLLRICSLHISSVALRHGRLLRTTWSEARARWFVRAGPSLTAQ